MKNFTAHLIFRYGVKGSRRRRVLCEARLVTIEAGSARAALVAARRYGKKESNSYLNADGDTYAIEFLGVADLEDLTWSSDQEVWHWMYETDDPKGRLKPVRQFRAFRKDGKPRDTTKPPPWWEAVPRWYADPALRKPVRSRATKRPRRGRSRGGSDAGA
jgi:hypothetical protein